MGHLPISSQLQNWRETGRQGRPGEHRYSRWIRVKNCCKQELGFGCSHLTLGKEKWTCWSFVKRQWHTVDRGTTGSVSVLKPAVVSTIPTRSESNLIPTGSSFARKIPASDVIVTRLIFLICTRGSINLLVNRHNHRFTHLSGVHLFFQIDLRSFIKSSVKTLSLSLWVGCRPSGLVTLFLSRTLVCVINFIFDDGLMSASSKNASLLSGWDL